MITNSDAVRKLAKINHSNSGVYISGKCESDLSGVRLTDGSTLSFTFDDVLAKKTELQNAEPMRLLRLARNQKLAKTDWWCASDRTPTQAQLDYRKSLRDLPSTASPSLDENGNLTGVTWPTKPE
jgi:hypothetical protein